MKSFLTGLGATHVLTYDDLDDASLKQRLSEWTGGKVPSGLFLISLFNLDKYLRRLVSYWTALEAMRPRR
jgi:hypothetical protein